jgi:hypothetical protein
LRQYEEINLLSAKQLSALSPEAHIHKAGLPGLPNSLVAFYWQDQRMAEKPTDIHYPTNARHAA